MPLYSYCLHEATLNLPVPLVVAALVTQCMHIGLDDPHGKQDKKPPKQPTDNVVHPVDSEATDTIPSAPAANGIAHFDSMDRAASVDSLGAGSSMGASESRPLLSRAVTGSKAKERSGLAKVAYNTDSVPAGKVPAGKPTQKTSKVSFAGDE